MHQDLKDYITQHSAGNIYWKDLNGRYLGCNEQYAEVLGLSSPQALVGLNDDDL
nr:hypothetical protein [Legionellales bacterium]